MQTFQNESELESWLRESGIDLSQWGVGPAKSVHDLWQEIVAGESSVTRGATVRRISLVNVILCRGGACLVEAEQELRPGEWRMRNRYPSEKITPGENPAETALRCLQEELHIDPETVRVRSVAGPESQAGESRSYPGLCTEYSVYQVEVNADHLPDGEFLTTESSGEDGRQPKTHRWVWQSQPVEGERPEGSCRSR